VRVCGKIALFLLLFLLSALGWAQERKSASADSVQAEVQQQLEKKQKDVKIFLEKIEILGRIEKPQTVFILSGKDPAVDDIQIDRSFFKEIFRKIERDDLVRRAQLPPR
jgi:hypothetical protein